MKKLDIFKDFIKNHNIIQDGVKLFSNNNLEVETFSYGKNKKLMLKRSSQMEDLILKEVNKILIDFNNNTEIYDGVIYMMYKIKNKNLIPLYIGKSEKYGKINKNLSVNISDKDKFCRWGYNYSYHMGDLSAVVCNNQDISKITPKYQKWAESLFENFPTDFPKLKFEVYFWIKAWKDSDISIWKEYEKTKLTFLEYLLIGIASELFEKDLLNTEGVNR